MVKPQAFVDEARTWKGTPYVHQQSAKGAGCDCVGLIKGTAEALGVTFDPNQWRRFANYARHPNPHRVREALALWLRPIHVDWKKPGDVLYLGWRPELPMHLAYLAEHDGRPTMIHALFDQGQVVEHGFVDPWPARLDSVWRWPITEEV